MTKRISSLQVRYSLGEILDKVNLRNDKYVVERKGKQIAAIVPVWQLKQWEAGRKQFFSRIDAIRSKNINVKEKEAQALVAEAVKAARSKKGKIHA